MEPVDRTPEAGYIRSSRERQNAEGRTRRAPPGGPTVRSARQVPQKNGGNFDRGRLLPVLRPGKSALFERGGSLSV